MLLKKPHPPRAKASWLPLGLSPRAPRLAMGTSSGERRLQLTSLSSSDLLKSPISLQQRLISPREITFGIAACSCLLPDNFWRPLRNFSPRWPEFVSWPWSRPSAIWTLFVPMLKSSLLAHRTASIMPSWNIRRRALLCRSIAIGAILGLGLRYGSLVIKTPRVTSLRATWCSIRLRTVTYEVSHGW